MTRKQDGFINLKLFESELKQFSHLDSEFDHHLAGMKKHILLLFDKKSKQMAALWIKKLCEISDTTNVNVKKIRNAYSQRLLSNLETNEQLLYPFNQKPPSGFLEDLNILIKDEKTSYESDNQDDIEINSIGSYDLNDRVIKSSPTNSGKSDQLKAKKYELDFSKDPTSMNSTDQRMMLHKNEQNNQNNSHNPFALSLNQHTEALKNLEDKQKYSQVYNLELQMKKLENRFQEEKICMQHHHNTEIQKILERKNSEIEKLKKVQKLKIKEDEDLINSLEKKVLYLEKNLSHIQEDSECKLHGFKKETTQILEMNQNDNEKKIIDLINNYEKEKYELQKQHTTAFQELVDETNFRLRKVESEYNEQQSITDQVILELENRTVLLRKEMDNNIKIIIKLENENSSLKQTCEKMCKQNGETKAQAEADYEGLKDEYKMQIENLKNQMRSELSLLKDENDKYIDKIRKLESDSDSIKTMNEKKIQKLKQLLNEKDLQIQNLNALNKKQETQAENALTELKNQIETDSKKLYIEMKEQITNVENDLIKSKSLREKQIKESNKQIEKLKSNHEKQIEKLNQVHLEKENALRIEFEEQKKAMTKQRMESFDAIQNQFQNQVYENNQIFQSKIENLTKTISQLDCKSIELQRELFEANSLRKNQIMELALLREDEKMKLIREKEVEIETIKLDCDAREKNSNEKLSQLKECHINEIKALTNKHNEQIQKLNQQNLCFEEKIKFLKEENKKIYQNNEAQVGEIAQKLEEEKNILKKHYQIHIMKLEQEKDNTELKLSKAYSDYEHSLTKFKMQYEEKQRGLMSNDIKKEYEETIGSLKSQIQILQQRIALLQTELDDRNHLINSSSCTASI